MTVTQLNELKAQRANSISEARKIHEKSVTEKRAFTGEEQTAYDGYMAEEARHNVTIQREERLAGLDTQTRKSTAAERPELDDNASPEARAAAGAELRKRQKPEYRAAFRKFLLRGKMSEAELRDLQTDDDQSGGYLVPPEQFVSELLTDIDDQVYVRSKARKFQLVKAKSLGAVKRTAKLASAAWGAELTVPTKDTSLKFGKRELNPHYITALAVVSRDLLMNSPTDPEAIVRYELARDRGELEEQAFLLGDGFQKPLGVFTASADGISTARDKSTGNTSTAITFDGLIEAKFGLKQTYRKTAEWMFHRDGVKQIALIKDLQNRYIWEPSKVVGEPDLILGLPYVESEWVPNTFTTGKYVGILANWSYYWIADALDMQIQRLVEQYALTNQDGFLTRSKVDGMPVIEEAFTRVKLA